MSEERVYYDIIYDICYYKDIWELIYSCWYDRNMYNLSFLWQTIFGGQVKYCTLKYGLVCATNGDWYNHLFRESNKFIRYNSCYAKAINIYI